MSNKPGIQLDTEIIRSCSFFFCFLPVSSQGGQRAGHGHSGLSGSCCFLEKKRGAKPFSSSLWCSYFSLSFSRARFASSRYEPSCARVVESVGLAALLCQSRLSYPDAPVLEGVQRQCVRRCQQVLPLPAQ